METNEASAVQKRFAKLKKRPRWLWVIAFMFLALHTTLFLQARGTIAGPRLDFGFLPMWVFLSIVFYLDIKNKQHWHKIALAIALFVLFFLVALVVFTEVFSLIAIAPQVVRFLTEATPLVMVWAYLFIALLRTKQNSRIAKIILMVLLSAIALAFLVTQALAFL